MPIELANLSVALLSIALLLSALRDILTRLAHLNLLERSVEAVGDYLTQRPDGPYSGLLISPAPFFDYPYPAPAFPADLKHYSPPFSAPSTDLG